MRKSINKLLMIVLSIVMLFSLAIGIGCDCSGTGSGEGGGLNPIEKNATVTLDKTSEKLIVGDYLTVVAYTNKAIDEDVVFESENESIATVTERGVIEAISAGTTNIVAKYGKATAKCQITVEWDDSYPVLIDMAGLNPSYVVYKNAGYEFQPAIRYRGRVYYDGQFTFSSSNEALVSFDGYKLQAKADLGVANCYVEGSWRGFTVDSTPLLRSDFTVEIVNEAYITLKGTSEDFIELYTRTEFEGQTYKNSSKIVPEFYANGEKVNVSFQKKVGDESLISYSNDVVTAKKYGVTNIDISCEYEGYKYVKTITIEIERPVADYEMEIGLFSSGVGTFKDANDGFKNKTLAEAIYGSNNVEIIEAYQDRSRLSIEDNKILGVMGANDDVYHTTVTIGTNTEIYNVPLEVYGLYIKEAADLDFFSTTPSCPNYYYLANDIDATGFTFDKPSNKCTCLTGLIGTFEGNGYVISNLTTNSCGIFGIVAGGTIRNLAITHAKATGYYPAVFGHRETGKATLKNVYVQIDSLAVRGSGLYQQTLSNAATHENVIVNYGISQDDVRTIMAQDTNNANISTFAPNRNIVYKDTNFKNCYSISYAPVGCASPNGTDMTWTAHMMAENQVVVSSEANQDGKFEIVGVTDWDKELLAATTPLEFKKVNAADGGTDVIKGIKAYQTFGDMAKDKTANQASLDSFDPTYWTVVDGIPHWKSLYNENIKAILRDANGDEVSDNTITDNTSKFTIALTDGAKDFTNLEIIAPDCFDLVGNTIKLKEAPVKPRFETITVSSVINGVELVKVLSIFVTPKGIEVNESIAYSLDDKALDFALINEILDLTGEDAITKDNIDVYYIGGDIEEHTGELILPVEINDFRQVKPIKVNLLVGDKLYALNKVMPYTKVIDEAEDFGFFTLTPDKNVIDGYVAVTKDIDATGYEFANHAFTGGNPYPGSKDVGFKGVFDGLGHTISNVTTKSNGIFGNSMSVIIKDVAFTNVNTTGYYPALFAHNTARGKDENDSFTGIETLVSNVYVEINSVSGNGGVLFNNQTSPTAKFQNVVVEFLGFDDSEDSKEMGWIKNGSRFSLLGGIVYNMDTAGYNKIYTNCFTISKAPLDVNIDSVKKRYYHFGENQVSYTLNDKGIVASATAIDPFVTQVLGYQNLTLNPGNVALGVKCYDDYAAMASDKANNTAWLETFNSDLWTVVNGVPYWKSLFERNIEVVVKDGENVLTDYVLGDENTTLTISLENKGAPVANATITAPSELVVSGNTIKLASKPMANASYDITVSAIVNGATITKTITIVVIPSGIKVDAVVNYSLDDKELDFNAINDALNLEGADALKQADIVSYTIGSDPNSMTGDVVLPVVITGEGANRAVEAQIVRLVIGEEIYELTNVMAYTKLIDEAEDLKYFTMTDEKNANDGYYLVTKDIDASQVALENHVFSTKDIYPSTKTRVDTGLSGVFDGNGHVISNVTAQSNGLFGNITAALIKNVAFTNVTVKGSYPSLFGHAAVRDGWIDGKGYTKESTVSDVYVEVTAINSSAGRVNLLINNSFSISSTLKNVVVEYDNPDYVYDGKSIGTIGGNTLTTDMSNSRMFENVYSISKAPLYSVGTTPYFAENQVEITERDKNGINITAIGNVLDSKVSDILSAKGLTLDKKYFAPRVKAYDDYSAMSKDAAANADSLATFDSKYWTIVNGVPFWKTVYGSSLDIIVKDGENVLTDYVLGDDKTQLTIDIAYKGVAIPGATITAPNAIVVDGNKIKLAEKPMADASYEVVVSATVNGVVVEKTITIAVSPAGIKVDAVVNYSLDDKALDFDAINKALDLEGEAKLDASNITSYYVGSDVEAKTGDIVLPVIITGAKQERVVEPQNVRLIANGEIYSLTNVMAYTKLIDEAEDLKYFTMTAEKGNNDGYYLVTKDLDASQVVFDNHVFSTKDIYSSSNFGSDYGLSGVFDGDGHVISNVTAQSNGLFGNLTVSLIKNVAFTNVVMTGSYPTLFAHHSVRGKGEDGEYNNIEAAFKNVYIEVDGYTGSATRINVLANNTLYTGAKIKNVVVEYDLDDETLAKVNAGTLSIGTMAGNKATDMSRSLLYENVYSISEAPLFSVGTTPYFAENQVEVTQKDGVYIAAVGNVLDDNVKAVLSAKGLTNAKNYYAPRVKAYADYSAMSKDAAANADSLATFDSKYWTVVNGVPYWNGTYANRVKAFLKDADGNVVSNVILDSAETKLTYAFEDGTQILTGAVISAPAGVAVNGNVISLASNPTGKGSYEVTISIVVEGKTLTDTITINYTNEVVVEGNILYSAHDKALDVISLNKALEKAGQEEIKLANIDAYYVGETTESTTELDLEVIVSGNHYDRVVDTAQLVKIDVDGKVFVLPTVYAYTKLIDEAEDLAYFVLTQQTAAAGIEGYYALAKNIDATNYVHGTHTFASGRTDYSGSADYGFRGVFDGLGYTISNFNAPSNGLFGYTTAPIIKNVAFTDASIGGGYPTLFAHSTRRDGWVDGSGYTKEFAMYDVYLEVTTINVSRGRANVIVNNSLYTGSQIHNVVVEVPLTDAQVELVYNDTLKLGTIGGNKTTNMSNALMFDNVYSISKAPLYSVDTTPYFAENQVEITQRNDNGIYIEAIGNVLDSKVTTLLTAKGLTLSKNFFAPKVKAYEDYTAMSKDATINEANLAKFNTNYWTVSNGVPTWKNL